MFEHDLKHEISSGEASRERQALNKCIPLCAAAVAAFLASTYIQIKQKEHRRRQKSSDDHFWKSTAFFILSAVHCQLRIDMQDEQKCNFSHARFDQICIGLSRAFEFAPPATFSIIRSRPSVF